MNFNRIVYSSENLLLHLGQIISLVIVQYVVFLTAECFDYCF